jgi:hypothetical protein
MLGSDDVDVDVAYSMLLIPSTTEHDDEYGHAPLAGLVVAAMLFKRRFRATVPTAKPTMTTNMSEITMLFAVRITVDGCISSS